MKLTLAGVVVLTLYGSAKAAPNLGPLKTTSLAHSVALKNSLAALLESNCVSGINQNEFSSLGKTLNRALEDFNQSFDSYVTKVEEPIETDGKCDGSFKSASVALEKRGDLTDVFSQKVDEIGQGIAVGATKAFFTSTIYYLEKGNNEACRMRAKELVKISVVQLELLNADFFSLQETLAEHRSFFLSLARQNAQLAENCGEISHEQVLKVSAKKQASKGYLEQMGLKLNSSGVSGVFLEEVKSSWELARKTFTQGKKQISSANQREEQVAPGTAEIHQSNSSSLVAEDKSLKMKSTPEVNSAALSFEQREMQKLLDSGESVISGDLAHIDPKMAQKDRVSTLSKNEALIELQRIVDESAPAPDLETLFARTTRYLRTVFQKK